MHNTILLTITMMLTFVSASAQFYTITKETEIYGNIESKSAETADIPIDTLYNAGIAVSEIKESEIEENSCESILNARKSDDYKSQNYEPVSDRKREVSQQSPSSQKDESLPELTIPNLLAEIKKNGIKYPKIVLAQAILETGWFKSSVCRNKHNLFGLTNPRTKDYYGFNHWTESVKAYYTKVQYRYYQKNKKIKGDVDYLIWLRDLGYAEDKGYVRAIIRVLRTLDNR